MKMEEECEGGMKTGDECEIEMTSHKSFKDKKT